MPTATEPLEVLDVLWESDPESGERLPVRKADALERLAASGQHKAVRLVERIPASADGTLDSVAVDEIFLAVHLELARLSEFVRVPQRMASSLRPVVDRLREESDGPVRVIDVGCGLGFDTRVMCSTGALGPGVEYVGLDFNALLIEAAKRLAHAESIPVRFVHGDALDPSLAIDDPDRTLMISSGVLHHIGRDDLPDFFARHGEIAVAGFAHFDPCPGFWTDAGAWMLHRTRMREPISRHDGALSMRRALRGEELLALARAGLADGYALECHDVATWYPQPDQIVRPIVGWRR
ncbi:class I SAM-dependent methyltransferase [Demequina sp. NBRC 110053]|uniref:class I SAM-dependent methyltransferase n=1 Tax=Demequina sp. NBRC 110053 TaxID=1570342 RepID=UPI0011870296|nr:class I SAM-dependent methyltransferase [Demequina sp. NBRC 110053]